MKQHIFHWRNNHRLIIARRSQSNTHSPCKINLFDLIVASIPLLSLVVSIPRKPDLITYLQNLHLNQKCPKTASNKQPYFESPDSLPRSPGTPNHTKCKYLHHTPTFITQDNVSHRKSEDCQNYRNYATGSNQSISFPPTCPFGCSNTLNSNKDKSEKQADRS